jgi:hypothetical protein
MIDRNRVNRAWAALCRSALLRFRVVGERAVERAQLVIRRSASVDGVAAERPSCGTECAEGRSDACSDLAADHLARVEAAMQATAAR